MKRQKKSYASFYLLVTGGVLIIIAALLFSSRNAAGNANTETSVVASSHDEETYPEIPRISIDDAKTALDERAAVFLDVRDADSYIASHIPDALNIPLAELQSRLGELDKGEWIITYCT